MNLKGYLIFRKPVYSYVCMAENTFEQYCINQESVNSTLYNQLFFLRSIYMLTYYHGAKLTGHNYAFKHSIILLNIVESNQYCLLN